MSKDISNAKGNRTDQDLSATELLYVFLLYVFRLNRVMGVSSSTLKKESRLYLNLVFVVKADGTEGIEEIVDSKPYVKVKDGKAWFSFPRHIRGFTKISIDRLKDNNSIAISRVFSTIKRSTCK